MAGWTKLEHDILQSSIWDAPNHVRIVWITLLSLQDKNGYVGAAITGIAHSARVSREEAEEAIEYLEREDPDSRDPEFNGRRIEKVYRGWMILNSKKYRGETVEEKRQRQNREAQERYREKQRVSDSKQDKQNSITPLISKQNKRNKNKNKNKIHSSDSSLRSSSPGDDLLSSVGSSGEKDPSLVASSLTNADRKGKGKTPGSLVWDAYSESYQSKYGIAPKRNAKNNKHCKELVARLGAAEAVEVARYYPSHRAEYHVGRGHSLGCLVADCETIYTASQTGQQITKYKAREDDRRETTRSALESFLAKRRGKDNDNHGSDDRSDCSSL